MSEARNATNSATSAGSPSRPIRVTDLSSTGWQEGPATSGVALRYDNPGGTVFATTPFIVIP